MSAADQEAEYRRLMGADALDRQKPTPAATVCECRHLPKEKRGRGPHHTPTCPRFHNPKAPR